MAIYSVLPLLVLLITSQANAQFASGGAVTSSASSSLGPAPTESIGCRVVDTAWVCAAPRAAQTSSTSNISSPAASQTPTQSGTTTVSASGTIPRPPAESTGCVPHGDHYHCAGPAAGYTGTPTSAPPTIPSPTESANCIWHETHWDCFGTSAEAEEAQDADESGECVIHVGHTHGDCSAAQLACGVVLLEDYNMPLHIASVFVILVTSGLAILVPLISAWFRKDAHSELEDWDSSARFGRGVGWWGNVFFIARHFGTGIILSTAFIHLLYHGFVMFANECIGHMSYESTAPAIAMAAAFITFLLDFLGSRYAHKQKDHLASHQIPDSPREEEARKGGMAPSPGDQGRMGGCGHHVDATFRAEQNHQVLILEAGIIFHSIMIGVTLGASGSEGWTTLFIVIIFHQMFEGLALGARLALLNWISRVKANGLALAYTLTTPIGIAIGIGARTSFSQNGKAALLSVGILNSISAGILLYTAFKLLSSDFINGPLRDARPVKVVVAVASMIAGLIAMSVLGKWA